MENGITYSEWLGLARKIRNCGIDDESYALLKTSYPKNLDAGMKAAFYNQVVELEKNLLESMFHKLERGLNEALSEYDIEQVEIEIARYIKRLNHCSFFIGLDCIGEEDQMQLYDDIYKNVSRFHSEVEKFLKRLCMETSGCFIDDVLYLIEKNNPSKYICEWRKNG